MVPSEGAKIVECWGKWPNQF